MTKPRGAASPSKATTPAKESSGQASTPYGYAWTDWLEREDPVWAKARLSVSAMAFADGQELSVKYREMMAIGVLCFRGQHDGVVAHMRRAIEALMHLEKEGAFKRG